MTYQKFLTILLSFFLIITLSSAAFSKARRYTVEMIIGNVLYSEDRGNSWKKAYPDMTLAPYSMLKTGPDASCDILLPGRGSCKITASSEIQLSDLDLNNDEMFVNQGKAFFNVSRNLGKNQSFRVKTRSAVMAVRGTEFVVEYKDETAISGVRSGEVKVTRNLRINQELDEDEQISVVLGPGKQIEITEEENRAIEATLSRVKMNLARRKKAVFDARRETENKIHLMENVDRVFDSLHQYDEKAEMSDPTVTEEEGEALDSLMDRVKKSR